ncbi:hypothetical protein [Chitinophaga sancti]|uniref:Uncharacterized protein n=1 Tax=Chitinophaga sancti TaxID=1004 RepID=A0ABZ0XEM9_9BACT|nr:hypothetical protein [Chitinophaga sancti]WQD65442.1 hypothetical protein U0033_13665 [Chitinophaga sancti]WQG88935.1 hypothetical protein SR876_28805 [Chitinophaga sancti]
MNNLEAVLVFGKFEIETAGHDLNDFDGNNFREPTDKQSVFR